MRLLRSLVVELRNLYLQAWQIGGRLRGCSFAGVSVTSYAGHALSRRLHEFFFGESLRVVDELRFAEEFVLLHVFDNEFTLKERDDIRQPRVCLMALPAGESFNCLYEVPSSTSNLWSHLRSFHGDRVLCQILDVNLHQR